MALIKCPECGHSISEYADRCISCGCPMDKIKELLRQKTKPNKDAKELSNSSTYQSLNDDDKALVNKICKFISKNTQLIKIDHSKNFGFRKKTGHKMIIVFKYNDNNFVVSFKGRTNLTNSNVKVTIENLKTICEIIISNYGQEFVSTAFKSSMSEEPKTFTSTRKNRENYLIRTFEEKLKLKIDGLVIKNNLRMFSFRILSSEDSYLLCWFTNGNKDRLAFKYYQDPLDKETQKVLYPNSNDADSLAETIYKIYLNLVTGKKTMVIENEYAEKIDTKINEPNKVPVIYDLIIKAMSNRLGKTNDDMTKVCNDVKSFVYKEIMHKSIEDKYFKNEEEFNRYKFSRRFEPNFFGYAFSLKNVSIKDSIIFYSYYKAIKLIGIIKNYETIYKETIVHDYLTVLHDYQKMLIKGDINYSLSKGLTSSFNLVPNRVLDECLEKLISLENIY